MLCVFIQHLYDHWGNHGSKDDAKGTNDLDMGYITYLEFLCVPSHTLYSFFPHFFKEYPFIILVSFPLPKLQNRVSLLPFGKWCRSSVWSLSAGTKAGKTTEKIRAASQYGKPDRLDSGQALCPSGTTTSKLKQLASDSFLGVNEVFQFVNQKTT